MKSTTNAAMPALKVKSSAVRPSDVKPRSVISRA
jgi:hypothetical protein